MAVLFVSLFAILAISFTAMSNINVQMSKNHRDVKMAQAAAESGLEFAAFLVNTYDPPSEAYSPYNSVSESEAAETFGYFANHVESLLTGSPILNGAGIFWDAPYGQLRIPAAGAVQLSANNPAHFSLLFEFVAGDENNPHHIVVTSSGGNDQTSRSVGLSYPIQKNSKVLEYAIASRGRMWITGDSTIEGDIYSGWDRTDISPFNMTNDSRVNDIIPAVSTLENM